jgi:beta-fructofuranosidase
MLGYKPQGMEMWDAWCIEHEDKLHMLHLQFLSPDSSRSQWEAHCLGHAISDDLLHWEEQELALAPGEAGSLDDLQPWTGCMYKHEDIFYLYYTMRSSRNDAKEQHIGLATSVDMKTWHKYPGNPVISPDPRWYVDRDQPLPGGVVDCRDLVILESPDGEGWYG